MPDPIVTPFAIVGRSGLDHTAGFIREEWVRELQGALWRRTIREMSEQDPTIGAVLYAVEMLMRQVKWDVLPANDELDSLKWAEFVKGAMFNDMSFSWEDTLAEILSKLAWGWSYLEVVYKYRRGDTDDSKTNSNFDDGLIGWRKWEIRSQDTLYNWQYTAEGSFEGMVQQAPPEYKTTLIPITKSLHFKTTSRKTNPEGLSVLRRAYIPWYFKKNIQRIEAIGIERDLAGLPVAFAPRELFSSSPSAEEKALRDHLLDLVTKIRRDASEGILFPLVYDQDGHQLYDLKLLSSGGSRQFDTNAIVRRYDESIAATMLADFILLGHNAMGSYALSSSKTALFAVALGALLDSIQSVINRFGIARLMKLNRVPREYWPELQHGDVETVDLAELGAYINALAGAGASIFDNPKMLPHLLAQAGLPTEGGGDEQSEDPGELTDEEMDELNRQEDEALLAAHEDDDEPSDEELDRAYEQTQYRIRLDELETALLDTQYELRQFHLGGKHNQKSHGSGSANIPDVGDVVRLKGGGDGFVVGVKNSRGQDYLVVDHSTDGTPYSRAKWAFKPEDLEVIHKGDFDEKGKPNSQAKNPSTHDEKSSAVSRKDFQTIVDDADKWISGLSSDEAAAFVEFSKSGPNRTITTNLRTEKKLNAKQQATVDGLEKAIDRSSMPVDATVYRTTNLSNSGITSVNDLVGKTIQDRAFMSTSTSRSIGTSLPIGDTVNMEIKIPKGAKAQFIDRISAHGGENEIVLQRNSKIRFTGTRTETKDGYTWTFLTGEVVP